MEVQGLFWGDENDLKLGRGADAPLCKLKENTLNYTLKTGQFYSIYIISQ